MKSLFLPFYLIFVISFVICISVINSLSFMSLDSWEDEYDRTTKESFLSLVNEVANLSSLANAEKYFRSAFENRHFNVDKIALEQLELGGVAKKQLLTTGVYLPEFESDSAYFLLHNSSSAFYISPDEASPFWREIDTKEAWDGVILLSSIALINFILLLFLNYRLKLIENTCEQLSKGNFRSRVKTGWLYDVGKLNRILNQMASKIFTVQEQKKHLINAVAHELRTPIFRLQCQLDLLNETENQQEQQAFISGAHQDLCELNELVEELLMNAKLDSSQFEISVKPTDIGRFLQSEITHIEFESHIPLILDIIDNVQANIDSKLLSRALRNILRNGLRFADSQVKVRLFMDDQYWAIEIENDGPSLSNQEAISIFEPFIRLDASRNRNTGGHGLGLSIARTIVEQHQGRIEVHSESSTGVCFKLSFPKSLLTQ